jgi:TP901 family phage tail tape measure protein
MADIQSNIDINIDTTNALSSIKNLQRQISLFHQGLRASGSAANAAISENMSRNLINSINATKKFAASYATVQSATQSFTTALEKNKFSMGQYFRYAAGSTKTFGRLFKTEFNTIEHVAKSRVKTLQTQFIKLGRDAGGAVKAIRVRPLALDMESLATKTAIAAQKQQIFNQLIKQGSTNLLNFGKNTQWAGRQLMVGFTIPLAYLGTTAARVFMDMEKQIIRLRRVYGDFATTANETEKMVSQIKELGNEFTKYGVAASKTMGLAADAAAMGKKGADLLAQVSEANRLAVLGGVEQEQALETTISITNAFGIAAEDLAGKINFLNAVENQSVTAIEDLTIAIPKAGPVIQQLGGSVEDLAFFLTAMKEGGINASEGANALKSGLASIINPSQKASEFMQGFGISIKGIVDANKGDVKGIVLGMADALNTLDPLNRARAIEQMFGKFQFARLSTLFQNVRKEGSQAQTVLGLAKATSEELAILSERELKKVEDSPMFKFQKAIEDIKVSLIPLGEQFLKLVTPIIEFGTKALEQFNKLDSGVKTFIMNAVGLLGGIAPVAIMAFGLIANGIANLIKTGNFLRNLFLRAGQGSNILGQQTQYMTNEQLEAAAAAASLDQAHQKLTQQFTVETTAVRKLAAAYNDAAIAGAKFTASGAVGRTRAGGGKTKGYKSGVLSVPGPKGAGDIVPAMLAPGEAVIPADKAKKYRGFISDMMQDRLPGFKDGRVDTKASNSNLAISVPPSEDIIYAKTIEDKKLISSQIENLKKEYGSNGTKIAQEVVTYFNKEKVSSKAFRDFSATFGEISFGISANRTGKILGESDKYQDSLRGYKGKPGENYLDTLREEAKTNPALKKDLDIYKRLGNTFYDAVIKDTQTQREYEAFLKKPGDSDAKRLANWKKQGLTPEQIKDRWFINKAIAVSGFDPKNPDIDHGLSRAHFGGLPSYIKRFPEGWSSQFTQPESRVINGFISNLSQDGKDTAAMKALIKANEKSPVEDHEKLFKTLRANGSLTPSQLVSLGTLANVAVKEGLDKTLANGRPMRMVAEGISKIDVSALTDRSALANRNKNALRDLMIQVLFKGKKPMNLAKGVVSVPGPKGAGDVVPAMLSPGEAVIPAAMSKKYAPLIDGMVNDTLPGYNEGRTGRFKQGLKKAGSIFTEDGAAKLSDRITSGIDKGISKLEKTKFGQRLDNSPMLARFGSRSGNEITTTSGATFKDGIQQKVDSLGRTYYVQPGSKTGRVSKEQAMQNTVSPEERKAQDKEARDARKQKLAGRAGGIGMVASTVGMGMMMSGDPGMQSAGGGVMAAGMLASVLPMLMNPIGAVVAGLVAVLGGVFLFNKALEDGSKKGYDFGKSMSITNDKLIQMSQITGRVTATEARKRRDESFMGAGGTVGRKFGMNYLESEAGKSILADVDAMKKQGNMSDEEIGKNVGKNLAYAVVQGAITEEEARSIAMGIGNKLQNYEIASNISANVVSILGPNGEDLAREPLKVMLEMQAENEKQLNQQFNNTMSGQQDPTLAKAGATATAIGTGVTTVLAGNAAVGTALALGATNFWNPVGWVALAAGTALVAAQVVNIANMQARNNELNAASISLAATQLQQNQGLLDSLAAQYDQKIRAKEAEIASTTNAEKRKKLEAELNQLINNRNTDTEKLQKRNSQVYQNLVKQSKLMGEENFDNAFKTNADAIYKDTPLAAFGTQAKDAIDKLDQVFNKDLKIGLSLAFLSKELDPGTINFLANAAQNDQTIAANYDLIVNQRGTAENAKLASLLVGSGLDQKNFSTTYDFFANIKNPDVWNDSMSALKAITDINGKYGVQINLNTNGQQKIERVQKAMTALNKLPKKITKETDLATLGLTTEELETIKGNWELFANTDGTIKKTILIDYIAANDPEAVMTAWAADQNIDLKRVMGGQSVITPEMAKASSQLWLIDYLAKESEGPNPATGDGDGDPTGGAGTDPLDELLNRLKMIRQAAVNASGKMQELFKWMKPGALENQDGSVFAGVEQQLGAKGYNADFIDFISSQEEAVRSKYVSISKAGIVTLKKDGEALQNLFNALTLGEYERSVRKAIDSSKQELDARKELLANQQATKMTYEEAVEASRDSGLAEAIAAIKASTNIKDKNAAIRQTIELYKEQKAAAEDAKTAEEQFNDLTTKVNKKLDADRNKITIDFELKTSGDKDVIAAAQNEINNVRNQLDDYNAGLTRLEPVEEAINKKYDDRIASLESIRDLNDKIAEQKNAELNISAALARGDVGAAAEAIQKEQQRQAKEAMDAKIKNLEKQREAELNNLTTRVQVNGQTLNLTKEEINKRIKDLEMQIFNIEEDRLEPAQTRVDLAMYERDVKLKALDDEKLKWDQLKNNIDLAATAATNYKDILAEAQLLASQAQLDYTNPNPGANDEIPAGGGGGRAVAYSLYAKGGMVMGSPEPPPKMMAAGGMVKPSYFGFGGMARGTDTVPAMLTPGEFIMSKYAVDAYGVDTMKAMNSGELSGGSVYNSYEVNVNVRSDANPDQIARAVMGQIKQINSQQLRGNRF